MLPIPSCRKFGIRDLTDKSLQDSAQNGFYTRSPPCPTSKRTRLMRRWCAGRESGCRERPYHAHSCGKLVLPRADLVPRPIVSPAFAAGLGTGYDLRPTHEESGAPVINSFTRSPRLTKGLSWDGGLLFPQNRATLAAASNGGLVARFWKASAMPLDNELRRLAKRHSSSEVVQQRSSQFGDSARHRAHVSGLLRRLTIPLLQWVARL